MGFTEQLKETANCIVCLICCIIFTGPVLMIIGIIIMIVAKGDTADHDAAITQWVEANKLWTDGNQLESWRNSSSLPTVKGKYGSSFGETLSSYNKVTEAASEIIKSRDDKEFNEQQLGLPTKANAPDNVYYTATNWAPFVSASTSLNGSTLTTDRAGTGSVDINLGGVTTNKSLSAEWFMRGSGNRSFNTTEYDSGFNSWKSSCQGFITPDSNRPLSGTKSYTCNYIKVADATLSMIVEITNYTTGAGSFTESNFAPSWRTAVPSTTPSGSYVATTNTPSVDVKLQNAASPWTKYDRLFGFGPTTLETAIKGVVCFLIGGLWTATVVVCAILIVKGCLSCFGLGKKKEETPATVPPPGAQMPQGMTPQQPPSYGQAPPPGYAQQPPAYAQQPPAYGQGPAPAYTQAPPPYAQ